MAPEVTVQVKRVRRGDREVPLPQYMTPAAAGMDLYACVEEPLVLRPGERFCVPTGIAVAVPDGFEGQVRPRSGPALRSGLTLLNAPGTIDADYRGEIAVLLVNLGAEPITVRRGDRIAQLVVAPVSRARWEEVAELGDTARQDKGFGHTDAS